MSMPESTKIDLRLAANAEEPYKLTVGEDFFASLDQDEITGGELAVEVEVRRYGKGYKIKYSLQGHVRALCDRCLEEIDYPMEAEDERLVGADEDCRPEDYDEILNSARDEANYSLAWPIYEIAELALPMHRVHPEGECNPQALETLGRYSAGN